MKNVLIFIAGAISGIVLFCIASYFIVNSSSNSTVADSGLMLFSEPGECISNGQFEIIQVLDNGNALAIEQEKLYGGDYMSSGITVLFLYEDGKYYYDGQIVKAPYGKCIKQVGVYKYMAKSEIEKTVPAVSIIDK